MLAAAYCGPYQTLHMAMKTQIYLTDERRARLGERAAAPGWDGRVTGGPAGGGQSGSPEPASSLARGCLTLSSLRRALVYSLSLYTKNPRDSERSACSAVTVTGERKCNRQTMAVPLRSAHMAMAPCLRRCAGYSYSGFGR